MARRRKKGRQVDSKSITTSLFRPCLSCYITIRFFSSTKSLLKRWESVRQKHQCPNYMRGIIPFFLVNKQYTLLTCSYKAFFLSSERSFWWRPKIPWFRLFPLTWPECAPWGALFCVKHFLQGTIKQMDDFSSWPKFCFQYCQPPSPPIHLHVCHQPHCDTWAATAHFLVQTSSPSISMPPVDLVAASAAVHDNNASPPRCRHLGPLAYILHELWASALCPQHCFRSCFLHWGNPETPCPCTSSPPSQ